MEDGIGGLGLISLVWDNFRYTHRAVWHIPGYISLKSEFILCDQYLGKDHLGMKCNKNLFCSLFFQVNDSSIHLCSSGRSPEAALHRVIPNLTVTG